MKHYKIELALSSETLAELIGAIRNHIDLLESGPERSDKEVGVLIDELIQLDMQITTDKELQDSIDKSAALCG